MTPRTKELNTGFDLDQYSQTLLSQMHQGGSIYDLTGEGALFKLKHPSLIRTEQLYESDPNQLQIKNNSYGWFFQTCKSKEEAKIIYPDLSIYGGFPKDLAQFMLDLPSEALIDFKELGVIHIQSAGPTNISEKVWSLQDYMISAWLDYALSPELWGPTGKWTRFHQRLHSLFSERSLLLEKDLPGHYPLTKSIQWIKDHGFCGKENGTSFTLTLPWDFPLTGVAKLETMLAEEP